MFSPVEYIGFDQMRYEIDWWAKRVHYAHLLETIGKDPSIAFENDLHSRDSMHFRIAQFSQDRPLAEEPRESERWREVERLMAKDAFDYSILFNCIFAKCLLKLDTLLASHDGKVMRPDDYVFIHMDRLDWLYPNWPLSETTELTGIFQHYERGGFPFDGLSDRYCFLDSSLGVLKLKNNSQAGFERAVHFLRDDDYPKAYFETHVEPFLGWAVVWLEEALPENMAVFLNSIGAFEQSWNVPEVRDDASGSTKKGKRPGPKPGPAKALFELRYPNGLPDDLSAEFVAAEFAAEGVIISSRQIANYDKAARLRN